MRLLTPDTRFTIEVSDNLEGKDLTDSINVVKESWVENVYQINAGDFNDNAIFIDIGANIGAVSLKVSSFNNPEDTTKKQIRVYAYEPEPHNLTLLDKNVRENHKLNEIKIINKGLWRKKETLKISNRGGNSKVNEGDQSIEVITLEDVFTDNGLKECDCLKMDIEGAEYEVFRLATPETLKRIKYLCLEFDANTPEEFGILTAKLAEIYNLHIIGTPSRGGYIYGRRY